MEGVSTRHMKCMGVWASGTTYINFEVVVVVLVLVAPAGMSHCKVVRVVYLWVVFLLLPSDISSLLPFLLLIINIIIIL